MDSSCNVQQVTKSSSDQLLRKFAESETEPARPLRAAQLLRGPVRRKRSKRVISGLAARDTSIASATCESPAKSRRRSLSVAERNSLLPTTSRRSASASASSSLLRKMAVGRSPELRYVDPAGIGLLLASLGKTWRRTVEGASNMFLEKRCNGHVRLISDGI